MKFVLRIYSMVWLIVIILYSFSWSKFSIKLDNSLLIFLAITIIISFVLSLTIKKNHKVKIESINYHRFPLLTSIIIFLYAINFLYAGYIPLFGIISGYKDYVEFPGIPYLYSFLVPFSLFYYIYISYSYTIYKRKAILLQCLIILILFLLVFSRNLLICSIISSCYIFLSSKKMKKRTIGKKIFRYTLLLILIIIFLYIFGGLGNLRSGYSWNDSSYIEKLGKFTNFPKFLPKQFMWAYLYIITPLSNLNYNVINNNHISSFSRTLFTFIPEFIAKRINSNLIVTSENQTLLVATYFNAQTVFVESYYCFGILGCYFTYLIFLLYIFIFSFLIKKNMASETIPLAALAIFISLSFFYNVFYYMLTSMLVIFSMIYVITKKMKLHK